MNTVPQLIHRNAEEFGDKPALTFDGVDLTWSETRLRIAQIAHGLARLGVGKGIASRS